MDDAAIAELTRDHVRLLVKLRRIVREEFDLTVHLHEDGAERRLLELAERSRSPDAKAAARELALLGGLAGKEESPPAGHGVRYRGAVPARTGTAPERESAGQASRPRRIYRGQVVDG